MDEQLKKELQEALYGALAAIYQNNQPKGEKKKTSQETKVQIVVSGDSLSLIKTIAEDKTIDKKITRVANAFEVLNGQLKEFENLKVMGPEGSFTNFVNFISLLASIPNIDYLKKFDRDTAANLAGFLTELSDGLKNTNLSVKMPDVASIVSFVNTFTDPEWIAKLESATARLNRSANKKAITNFLKAVASIFDDEDIKRVFFKDPGETIDGKGIYGLIGLLNWFTQDKFFSKITKANLAIRLGAGSAIKKFFDQIGSIYLSKYILDMTREKVDAISQIMKMLDSVASIGFLIRIELASKVLTYQKGARIANFFNGFIENLTKVRLRDFSKATNVIDSVNGLISTLTNSILLIAGVSLLIAYTRPITAILTMSAIIGMEILLVKTILDSLQKFDNKNSIESIKSFNELIKSLTICMGSIAVTSILIKTIGEKPIIEALALFGIVTFATLGIAFLLSKSQDTIKLGKKGAEGLALLVGTMGVTMILIALTGVIAKNVDIGSLIITGVIFLAVMGLSVLIASWWEHNGKDSMMGLLGLTALILGLGINLMLLAATALMVGSVKASDWGLVMGLVFAELLMFGAIGLASKYELIGKQAIKGVVELIALMTGLSLNLMLLVATALLAKDVNLEDIGMLAALVGLEIGIAGILVAAANSKALDGPGVKTKLAVLELLLLGLSVNMLIATEAAKNAKSVTGDEIWKIAGILGIEIVILGILAGIGYAVSTVSWSIGILEVLLAGLLGISWLTIQVAKAARSVTIDDVKHVADILWELSGVATVFGIVATAMGALSPLIAIGEVLIGGMLLIISKSLTIIDKTIDLVKKYKDSNLNFKTEGEAIAADIAGFMGAIAKEFGNPITNIWYTLVNTFFVTRMMPILFVVSKFIDIIGKVAKMNIIVGYDSNGNPIFEKVNPSVFGEAASKVTTGFGSFINTLADDFKNMNLWGLILIETIGDTLSPIMDSVSKYVDAILKLATSTYISGYDDNGNPIFEKTDPAMFNTAATVISNNFKTFLEALIKEANNLSFWSDGSIEAIGKAMKPAMEGVSAFADAILKLATGTYITGYDSNGKPEFEHAKSEDYAMAAIFLTGCFSAFLKTLVQEANNLGWLSDDSLEAIGDSIKPVMEGVSAFADAILKIASGTFIEGYDGNGNPIMKKVTSTMFGIAARQLISLFRPFMTSLITEANKLKDDEQQKALKAMSESVGPLMSSVGTFADAILKLATGTYTVGYDEKGKPIFKHIEPIDYVIAAVALTDAIGTFMDKLTEKLDGDLSTKSADVINKITKGGLKDMMDAVAKFAKVLSANQFAIIGYDEKGNPKFQMEGGSPVLASVYYPSIAENIASAISLFITTLDSKLTGKEEIVAHVASNLKALRNVFDPLNKFTNSMKSYSEMLKNLAGGSSIKTLATNSAKVIHTFLSNLYGNDGTKLDKWANSVAKLDAAKQAVDKAVATVLLLKSLVNLDIDKINENIAKYHQALNTLLAVEFVNKTDLFNSGISKIELSMDRLRMVTNGLPSIASVVSNGAMMHLAMLTVTVNNIAVQLSKFDNKVLQTSLNLQKVRNDFTETVDKIEAKLKKNESDRNKMLKDLTTHLDTIGNKLKTISSGLKEINSSSMDKVEELAKVFAEMQQQQIQMMVEYVSANKPEPTEASVQQVPQPANNNFAIAGQPGNVPDNYFGGEIQFTVLDATQGQLRGMLKRMT